MMEDKTIKDFLSPRDKFNIQRIRDYHSFNLGRFLREKELISIALQNEGNYIEDLIMKEAQIIKDNWKVLKIN